MIALAGFVLAAAQLLDVAAIEASNDARIVPHLFAALDRSVAELSRHPESSPPPDLANELVAALVALERLDGESALERARVLTKARVSARLGIVAHRVAARAGDAGAVRAALARYFEDPDGWRLVLGDAAAATGDVRLRDFLDFAALPDPPTDELARTTLLRLLGDEVPFPSISSSPSPPEVNPPHPSTHEASPSRVEPERLDSLGVDAAEVYARHSGAVEGRDPDALVVLYRFHQLYPRRFLRLLDVADDALRERAQRVMALSGDRRRLPLLIELATAGRGPGRDAAFRGLAEMDLGHFDRRLHRLAGDPDPAVRFQSALALVPTGEEWALRLLVAELDDTDPFARLRTRRALERLETLDPIETLIADGTATPFVIELYLSRMSGRELGISRNSVWEALAPHVAAETPIALVAAARLDHRRARAAVRRYLGLR